MNRHVCIHGHFYQPPRENPWTETIDRQDSAFPYADWNQRITAECYAANAAAPVFDDDGHMIGSTNNFARISFNVGPTLLAWLEAHAPETYAAILAADRESRQRFAGHGSAIAQPYNHMILPLANPRDKTTQVRWGVADFAHRFGRPPAGMWLPETAVDVDTLEVLAAHDIRFVILAPRQARRVRPLGAKEWTDVDDGTIDTTQPYVAHLPSGRTIALFFYHAGVSQGIAFGTLLASPTTLTDALRGAFTDDADRPELIHVATDGETYGHHCRYGAAALAGALRAIETSGAARLTNYSAFLDQHPPAREVEIIENTAWSCTHGVGRWREDCGCHSGRHRKWNQKWRRPLREALDALRDAAAAGFERVGRTLLGDPWAARDDYAAVLLDHSAERFEHFLGRHAVRALDDGERSTVRELLELQRDAMLMHTSCGWFFDDISGLEPIQNLHFAARVIELSRALFGDDYEPALLARLADARSNVPPHPTGADLYRTRVLPAAKA